MRRVTFTRKSDGAIFEAEIADHEAWKIMKENHEYALKMEKVVEAARLLFSSLCEESRDVHGMLELEEALEELEK